MDSGSCHTHTAEQLGGCDPAGPQADRVSLVANTTLCPADSTEEESAATGGEADSAESLPSSRRRRQRSRSRAASPGELRERWSWLSEIKPEDKPWIYFALHRAYHAKVASSHQQAGVCAWIASAPLRISSIFIAD